MKSYKEEIKKIVKENPFKYIGIRGTEEELKIGEELDTSYQWDHILDCSTYETDEPIELGGVCAVDLTHEYQSNDWIETKEDMKEVLDFIKKRIENHLETYKYPYNYIVLSSSKNPLDFDENDENEIILEDAVVVLEIK